MMILCISLGRSTTGRIGVADRDIPMVSPKNGGGGMIKSGLAWNKGRKVGQKRALRPQDVWMIRGRLRAEGRKRDLALFNLAIDSNYLPAISSPCKSKMSATIVCIGVLRTPKKLRSGG